jgi:hypothetical protein
MFRSLLLILTLFALTAVGQSPAKILKRAEKALGGAKALQARNSLEIRGRITRKSDGAGGEYRLESSRPNLLHVVYDIGGSDAEMGYNGRSGWRRDSAAGLQTLTGAESLQMQMRAAFQNSLWLNAKADKLKIVSAGRSTVGSRPVDVVNLVSPKGTVLKVSFDAATGLPLREEIGSEIREYDDYRAVGPFKLPYTIRMVSDTTEYEIRIDDIILNRPIEAKVFDFPRVTDEPLPDLTKLLADLRANQDRIEQLLETYSYTRDVTSREADKSGKLIDTESETQQMSFYKGYRIERTIAKNGKPLSASDQADEDKAVAKRVESIEKRISRAEKDGKEDEEAGSRSVSIAELLRASKLINPRRERFRGRDVIVFDFEPDPSFDYKNAKSMLKFFGKTAGVIWVDENDKQLVRVEAYLADDFSVAGGLLVKLKKGATFTGEQARFNDEIWLPSLMEINLNARVLLFKGVALNQVIRSYEYRKFQTEVRDASVNEVKKP